MTHMRRNLIWAAVILLAVLHHDFWFWDDRRVVFGFLPIGLAYHALFSISAAAVWALALKFAWPHRIEEWAGELEAKHQAPRGAKSSVHSNS